MRDVADWRDTREPRGKANLRIEEADFVPSVEIDHFVFHRQTEFCLVWSVDGDGRDRIPGFTALTKDPDQVVRVIAIDAEVGARRFSVIGHTRLDGSCCELRPRGPAAGGK